MKIKINLPFWSAEATKSSNRDKQVHRDKSGASALNLGQRQALSKHIAMGNCLGFFHQILIKRDMLLDSLIPACDFSIYAEWELHFRNYMYWDKKQCLVMSPNWNIFPRYWNFVRGSHRSPVNSPHKGQWRGALMFSLIFALNKRLSKQPWGWWFETPSCSLWRHCNCKYIGCNPSGDDGLTHWGRVTHRCVIKLSILGSDNGLSPCRRQAII